MPSQETGYDQYVVRASSLCKEVGMADTTIDILSDINLAVEDNTTVSISGSSGSGKTTLLGLLAGLDTPSSGSVTLFGQPVDELDEDARAALRRGRVGFVFQSFHLLPNLTALENVSLALEMAETPKDIDSRAADALGRVGLARRLGHLPSQLSGGEQQRVALARAMVVQPRLLFADEPTGNLDHATREQVAELLFDLREEHGCTLILVTHDPSLAGRCDRQYRLDAGRLAP
jgi:putative ABC transport system ATP-binding protein